MYADTSGNLSVVSGKTYQIHYETKDSQVQNVLLNKESQSLIFSVITTSPNSSLQLTLPRELIDATRNDGTDDKFIVLVDKTFATETEKRSSPLTRTILIPLTIDNKEVEIIGTHIGGIITTGQKNGTESAQPHIIQEKPVVQKPMENKTGQQLPNKSTVSQPSPTMSLQDQILQQMTSLLHFKSGSIFLDVSKKQIVEYSIIAAIVLVMTIVITSSVRSKNKKSFQK